MDSEILCRGKRLDNGAWIEGFYFKELPPPVCFSSDRVEESKHYILFQGMSDWGLPRPLYKAEVDPNTVSRYTGLTDKNGVKIFQGDFVTVDGYSYEEPERTASGYIEISPLGTGLRFSKENGTSEFGYLCDMIGSYLTEYTIYGNTHDNPELFEEA